MTRLCRRWCSRYNRGVRRSYLSPVWQSAARLIAACAWLAGCAASEAPARPVALFAAPPEAARFAVSEPVTVRVAAAASGGVSRVELLREGALIGSQASADQAPLFTARFVISFTQTGPAVLQAVAYDGSGAASPLAQMTLEMVQQVAWLPTPASGGEDTGAAACIPGAEFVSDVTIPDHTAITAGTPFVKTWRVRNTGACSWGQGYELVYIQGRQMNAPNRVPIAPVRAGSTADISVTFIAPADSGVYTSTWQLRSAQGILFGNRLFTTIQVP